MELAEKLVNMQKKGKCKFRTPDFDQFLKKITREAPRELYPLPNRPNYRETRLQANFFRRQTTRFAYFNSLLSLLVVVATCLDNEAEYYHKFTFLQATCFRLFILAVSTAQIAFTIKGAQAHFAALKLNGDIDSRCML